MYDPVGDFLFVLLLLAVVIGVPLLIVAADKSDKKHDREEQSRYEQCVKENKDWVRQVGGKYVCVTQR